MGARAGELPGGFQRLKLRRVPGPPDEYALQGGNGRESLPAHSERERHRPGPALCRVAGNASTNRWRRGHATRSSILYQNGANRRRLSWMRILLASSEAHPYSKTGGLADMVGALGKTLARAGHEVGLVTPLYAGVRERFPQLKSLGMELDFPLGPRRVAGEVLTLAGPAGFTVYFVEASVFYDRPGLYQIHGTDYSDNAERFIFFSKAIAHLGRHLPWQPEVVHLHDWQTGFAALFLRSQS